MQKPSIASRSNNAIFMTFYFPYACRTPHPNPHIYFYSFRCGMFASLLWQNAIKSIFAFSASTYTIPTWLSTRVTCNLFSMWENISQTILATLSLVIFFVVFFRVVFFCLFVDTNPCCFLLVDAHLHFPYIKSRRKNWAIVNALLFASCSCRHRRSYAASQRLCIYKIDKIFSFRTYHFEQWIFACFSFIA